MQPKDPREALTHPQLQKGCQHQWAMTAIFSTGIASIKFIESNQNMMQTRVANSGIAATRPTAHAYFLNTGMTTDAGHGRNARDTFK